MRKPAERFVAPISHALSRFGIKPNVLTLFSFLCGLACVYFFLSDWTYFVIFAALHLLFDVLDGSVARFSGAVSKQGKWMDWWSDRTIAFLIIAKCGYKGLITYAPILAGAAIALGILTNLWFAFSKKDVPVLCTRLVAVCLGILSFSNAIIPVAIGIYVWSLCWQVWYTLNNI